MDDIVVVSLVDKLVKDSVVTVDIVVVVNMVDKLVSTFIAALVEPFNNLF